MSKGKKFLIALLVLVAIATAAVFYFHDDTDVAEVEVKQDESADSSSNVMHDNLENSFNDLDSISMYQEKQIMETTDDFSNEVADEFEE
ncbi:MAG: hypothetical protein H6600_00090 [Flavobacteriales bacterium]|nr:hypothetical protein [Flavobacteriales bacterium]